MVWSNQAPTSITIPPGATDGARIIIDSQGMRVYNSSDGLVLNIVDNSISQSALYLEVLNSITGSHGSNTYLQLLSNVINLNADSSFTNAIQWAFSTLTGPAVLTASNTGNPFSAANPNTIQFLGGNAGGYYATQYLITNQTILTGAFRTVGGYSILQENTDYGECMNFGTAQWKCPTTDWYSVTIQLNVDRNPGATDLVWNNSTSGNNVFSQIFNSTGQQMNLTSECYLTAGNNYQVVVSFTNSLNTNTTAVNPSYLLIKRHL
jgi:hypothetical protein